MMQGKMNRVAKALFRSRLLNSLKYQGCVFLAFHRVYGDDEYLDPMAQQIDGPRLSVFKDQMLWLSRHRKVVSEDQLISALKRGHQLPPGSVHISFDDGYLDNHDLALPVLQECGLSASFFVTCDFIEKRRMGWWDDVVYCCIHSCRKRVSFRGRSYHLPKEAFALAAAVVGVVKKSAWAKGKKALAELKEQTGLDGVPSELAHRKVMTWQHVKALADAGMAIGSHTLSHRVLSTLDPEEQKTELLDSKSLIEAKLGQSVRSIAYPVGGNEHIDEDTLALTKAAGYDIAFTYLTGAQRRIGNPLAIRRIDNMSDLHLMAMACRWPNRLNRYANP